MARTNKIVSFTLPPDAVQLLEVTADATGKSASRLTAEALRAYLNTDELNRIREKHAAYKAEMEALTAKV